MNEANSNMLVTGATGFVGSSFCAKATKTGYYVRRIVRKRIDSDEHVIENIDGSALWKPALDGIDTVVHLAARVHVMKDKANDPLAEFRRVNTQGTLNLARQAAGAGVRRFVFLSSIKVNGEYTANSRAFTENDQPNTVDPYALSKLEAEQSLLDIASNSDMEVVIIRPPLVYGPGVKGNFASMIKWVGKGLPLPFGAVHNKRSFIALDNLVDFILLCIKHPGAANEIFLISDGEDISTTELLQKVGKALDKRVVLLPVPVGLIKLGAGLLGKRDIADRLFGSLRVDSSKARQLLGWKPVVSMDEQLRGIGEG